MHLPVETGPYTRVSTVIGIVDDDASVLRAVRRLLGGAGFAVKAFESAEEFLSLEHPETIQCLVLDVHMPGLSGFELQERLTATQAQQDDGLQHLGMLLEQSHFGGLELPATPMGHLSSI